MLKQITLLLICLCVTAYAEPLRVALFDVEPYAKQVPGTAAQGVYVEIANLLAREAGMTPSLALMPFPRVAATVAANKADLTFSFETEQLKRDAHRIGPLVLADSILVSKRGLTLTEPKQVAGRIVGRLRGGCADLIEVLPGPPSFYDLPGFDSGLRMLLANRVDVLCTTREAFKHYLKQTRLARDDFGDILLLHRRQVWIYTANGLDVAVRVRLERAAERIRKNGTLDAIWSRYVQVGD
ncbi:ABC transporter substrate-binding protein [Chitinimonas sp. BJYL2]|uniref:substrate-binding periplasmic protein n=1 Tax=Chitinimonas sp. BJYL2 TaxID=2976696 RepID=UPI0022B4211E|nr:transporter substrate-binding domain-containing protein [Chitinimonas sp. BJYL2]